VKPFFGKRFEMGVWPPSKPALGFPLPERAFWPLCPRPEVLPNPELRPRPRRFCFCGGFTKSARYILWLWREVLTVCREPTEGCRLNRCTRVLDARAAADMVDWVNTQAAGNVRGVVRPGRRRLLFRNIAFTNTDLL
jgi:hypothetical protein